MIPLRDSLRSLAFPLLTTLLIAVNCAVFAFEITRPTATLPAYGTGVPTKVKGFDRFTAEWGFVPCELLSRCERPGRVELSRPDTRGDDEGDFTPVKVVQHSVWFTLLSAMFMHGGWLHLAGNMLFLWVFGSTIEGSLGRLRYLAFYLVCGLIASLSQLATSTTSDVPNIGASGAIAGVLGGYLLLHPRARVLTVVPLLFFLSIIEIPALFVLGLWFALQLLDGSAALVASESAGIAYWAHVGGFVAGFLLIKLFAIGRGRGSPPGVIEPIPAAA